MSESKAIVAQPQSGALQQAYGLFTPSVVREQINAIQEVMRDSMQNGTHYGVVPGCGDKPTLLKPGAEKLGFTFRLAPDYEIEFTDLGGGHREYRVTCRLTSIHTGAHVGSGVGICTTMESKYRYRKSERKCPACGAEAIIKGKDEYGGGWLCWAKKGGCGAKFADHDSAIISQPAGKVENPDIADTYNTVLKMAKKRAHVDAILTATAASDIFTQDIEDVADLPVVAQVVDVTPEPQQAPPPSRPRTMANRDEADADAPAGVAVVPFGKNKGTPITQLSDSSLSWYHERAIDKGEGGAWLVALENEIDRRKHGQAEMPL